MIPSTFTDGFLEEVVIDTPPYDGDNRTGKNDNHNPRKNTLSLSSSLIPCLLFSIYIATPRGTTTFSPAYNPSSL